MKYDKNGVETEDKLEGDIIRENKTIGDDGNWHVEIETVEIEAQTKVERTYTDGFLTDMTRTLTNVRMGYP